jgi:hypothetical protein
VLSPHESRFLNQLKDLPLENYANEHPNLATTPPSKPLANLLQTFTNNPDLDQAAQHAYV